jgi:trehalose 6-phosphate synthase/phosphatase
MRDGMNLVCKEYIASKLDKKGVLILSEMAGSSKELSDAILINPNNIEQMVDAIHRALTMPEDEQVEHIGIMQESLKRYNIHQWVKLFMDRLNYVKSEQSALQTELLNEKLEQNIVDAYHKAKKRLLFLDYDGTLTGFNLNPDDSKPDEELKTILQGLTKNPKNQVIVISGRGRSTLAEWLKDYNLEIVAEHGVWMKTNDGDWKTLLDISTDWKKEIMSVLEGYVNRTPGSFVEEKDYSLVWHYRKVETGLGEIRTRELTSHLKYLTADKNLQVLEGDMVVEIKNSEINKGRGATEMLKRHQGEFIIACGDDWTDEDTFRAMPKEAFTVKVGNAASVAMYRVTSYTSIRSLLMKFTKN